MNTTLPTLIGPDPDDPDQTIYTLPTWSEPIILGRPREAQ